MFETNELDIAFKNSLIYGTGFSKIGCRNVGNGQDTIIYYKAMSQYSFGLWYFDDWRCVVEYLKREKGDNNAR